ncbi:MAG: zf-HC2 domain-containing protein [Acidobacteriota bacterium]|nr:zf-HC2 domain-containing protein [Acidobacteriota bacterium]
MALEQHNTTFEFETMLRSHLSAGARGGSIVEACGGFDADTASAYLEDALGQAPRSRYDAHLAGCPPCRRSVIDLSRLIRSSLPIGQLAKQSVDPQTLPVVIPSHEGVSWKSAVAGWLGLSEWNLATRNWGLATAGMAGAVLLAILATQLWRQPRQPQQVASSATDGNHSSSNLTALPTPGEKIVASGSEIALDESQTPVRPNVASPALVGPMNQPPTLSGKTDNVNSISTELVTGLASLGNTTEVFPPNLPAPSPNVRPVLGNSFASSLAPNFTPLVESKQPVALPEPPPEAANARILTPLNPSPSDNPMGRGQKDTPTPNVFNRAFAFVPTRKDVAERKPEVKEIEEGAPKVLAIRVRDKVFNFRSGMWIDQAYKPDMAWRITKLTQDSDEYKKVLTDEPQLKDFFERGAVIVIWKDKIYKVVAR